MYVLPLGAKTSGKPGNRISADRIKIEQQSFNKSSTWPNA